MRSLTSNPTEQWITVWWDVSIHGGMRQFFRRRLEAATGPATKHDPPERSVATAPSSTGAFPLGIKLLHNATHATVEYIHFHSKLQNTTTNHRRSVLSLFTA